MHCGFCTATCPTYVLLGDELDSPRGRIYLIKEMLEHDRPATADVVKHIDRCLSCLACMTTCPSGVHYMHLVDHAREHIEKTYKRPLLDRAMRGLLARVLPDPALFRLAVVAGLIAKPFAPVLQALGLKRMAAMLRLTPRRKLAPPVERTGKVYAALGARRGRVALLSGCINPVLAPATNEAAIRLLNRNGIEVVVAAGEACCGSLAHHMGREDQALAQARNNIDAWMREIDGAGLDAILITVSGCGTTVKDYGFMLRGDRDYAVKAARISGLTKGHHRISGDARFAGRRGAAAPYGRLSCGLLIAARTEGHASAERIALQVRLRGQRCAGRAFVLRLGRDLQHSPAGAGGAVARPQDRQYRTAPAGCDRGRQYRLHHADRRRHRHPGRAYGRTARLGDRRPGAGRP